MTLHVYRVARDGTVTADRGTITVLDVKGPVPVGDGYPPCRCPRCRSGRAVSPLGDAAP
ncbi:hypothetical protein SUDANB145_04985 [Streptomyces sp. enrichment culture]